MKLGWLRSWRCLLMTFLLHGGCSSESIGSKTVHSAPNAAETIVSDAGLPHCKKTAVVEGKVTHQNVNSAAISVVTTVQLRLGLGETACFHVQFPNNLSDPDGEAATYNGTLLYTLRFTDLVHHHPIKWRYQFAIPRISTKCICDCLGGDNHCDISSYHYKNCTDNGNHDRNSLCYRTYHANQSPAGCIAGDTSELCCDIILEPYKNEMFWAMHLTQPNTVAIFDYKLYEWSRGRWRTTTSNEVDVSLNNGIEEFKVDDETNLRVSVSGSKPHRQLQNGMYFMRENEHALRQNVLINDFYESDLQKLGWFRRVDGRWMVHKGLVKMTAAQHATVRNCKMQEYVNTFDAEQIVMVGDDSITNTVHLGKFVDQEPWVSRSYVSNGAKSRYAVVSLAEGTPLTVTLSMENSPQLRFYHHTSMLGAFNGSIHLDRESNRYLNVSFVSARGTLIGSIYATEQRQKVDVAFSTYVGTSLPSNFNTILTLPAKVNGSRYVCFHPSGQPDQELCKWCNFYSKRIDWFMVPHRWQTNTDECIGCNEVAVANFIQYLNPKQWFDGIGSTSESLALIFELAVYAVVVLLVIALIRKCIWPLFRWTFCTSSPKKG